MPLNKHITKIGKVVTVSWTESRQITIGHHACIKCGELTPEPTTEQKLEVAKSMTNSHHEYMWPNRYDGNDGEPGFKPTGWSWFASQHYTGWLCFDCTQEVNAVVGSK